ncbi:hypothetical protein HOLleu_23398 [Holothuria leucospilota]|uniref:Uncharacterized protein n=1 Tax=Holothuria leucospilota TaxID=206669 RepID=A0A9Q1H5L7_HOLLE|nr:hypothetical protein HOLleu_23398 [Holothuria leucospilota]
MPLENIPVDMAWSTNSIKITCVFFGSDSTVGSENVPLFLFVEKRFISNLSNLKLSFKPI